MNADTILFVGAHPDDIELGSGATIKSMADDGFNVHGIIMSHRYSSRGPDAPNMVGQIKEAAQLLGYAPSILDYPDQMFDTVPLLHMVQDLEALIQEIRPTMVVTHSPTDLNLDHQLVARAVLTACRPLSTSMVHEVRHFHVPSATDWSFQLNEGFRPNTFVQISTGDLDAKVEALGIYGESPPWPHPRSEEALRYAAAHYGSISGQQLSEPYSLSFRREGW